MCLTHAHIMDECKAFENQESYSISRVNHRLFVSGECQMPLTACMAEAPMNIHRGV